MLTVVESTQALSTLTIQFFFHIVDVCVLGATLQVKDRLFMLVAATFRLLELLSYRFNRFRRHEDSITTMATSLPLTIYLFTLVCRHKGFQTFVSDMQFAQPDNKSRSQPSSRAFHF